MATTDFKLIGTVDKQFDSVITRQRAVYNWYETHHSDDDVVDIYSPEWQKRLTSWYKWFVKTYGADHGESLTTRLREVPEELDFRSFFFEHPIAAFSLWRVIEAFYDFDKAVLGPSDGARAVLAGWRKLKPFQYLRSPEVQKRWKSELKRLDVEISYGDLAGEELKSTMYGILRAVERIEAALDRLEDDLASDYHELKSTEWMLATIVEALDRRCLMIEKLPRGNVNRPPPPPRYEAVVSERSMGVSHDSLVQAEPPVVDEDLGYANPFLLFLDYLHFHVRGITYVIVTVIITFLALYISSHAEGLSPLSRYYE